MPLPELELRGVLDGDDALVAGNVSRENVEKRGLAAARAPTHENVGPCHDAGLQKTECTLAAAAKAYQVLHLQRSALELADVQLGTIDSHRRNGRVDAGAVGQTRIADGALSIDPAAYRFGYVLDKAQRLLVAGERDWSQQKPALYLHVHVTPRHHYYLGDIWVGEQWGEWPHSSEVLGL